MRYAFIVEGEDYFKAGEGSERVADPVLLDDVATILRTMVPYMMHKANVTVLTDVTVAVREDGQGGTVVMVYGLKGDDEGLRWLFEDEE